VTSDERNLLLLLAKMVLTIREGKTPTAYADEMLLAQIRRVEDAESRKRDAFVLKFIPYTEPDPKCLHCRPIVSRDRIFSTPGDEVFVYLKPTKGKSRD
jgi:hypothetical protein